MKKLLALISVLAVGFWAGHALAGDMGMDMHKGMKMHHKMMKMKPMKYEVVDLSCYETSGTHGPKHKACAVKCIDGGAELGLLRGGRVYLPVDQDFHSAREQFVPKAGEMVEVAGKVYHRGGSYFLQVASSMDAK